MFKKLFAFIIIFVFIFLNAITNISVQAQPSVNLVKNPGFEGALENWSAQSGAKLEILSNANSGSLSCKVSGRTETFSSPLQNMTEVLKQWGPGDYLISAYVKIDSASAVSTDKMSLVLYTIFDSQKKWLSVSADINKNTYTKIEGIVALNYTQALASCNLYLQSTGSMRYDYYCDDFSVQKVNGLKEPLPDPTPMPLEQVKDRPDKTLVGAIRWDAYINPNVPAVGTTPENYIGEQVSRVLSPAQYHFRLPYYGIVESQDKVTFPDYTQDICNQEILYAKEAGIDYFMYDWYDSAMATARKLHITSPYKNEVKMTTMWNISSIPSSSYGTYIEQLKVSCWQTVDGGRPMIYIESTNGTQSAYYINNFRNACMAAGLKNPYLIGLQQFGITPALVKSLGLDAYSDYAVPGSDGKPYAANAAATEAQWQSDSVTGVQVIPLVSTGWDARPIFDHPYTWYITKSNNWVQTATPAEIASHLQKALDFNKAHPGSTNINSVLIYAWNENTEGGWLCPTIIDDDRDGLPQKRADGTNARDTLRLQAIQQVLRPGAVWALDKDIEYLSGTLPAASPTFVSSSTPSSDVAPSTALPEEGQTAMNPTADQTGTDINSTQSPGGPDSQLKKNSGFIIYMITAAAILGIGGTVGFHVIKNKRKRSENITPETQDE